MSLGAQWIRTHLPVQRTQVQSLPSAEQLSPYAAAAEPVCLEPVLCPREATAMRSMSTTVKGSPHAPQLKSMGNNKYPLQQKDRK